jgi:hypothetical protein
LKSGTTEVNYTGLTTDPSGFFTTSVSGLPNGTYNWRAKGTIWLANAGTLVLTAGTTTHVEMGLLRAGDSNGDNIVSAVDFSMLRASFGRSVGEPNYDARADWSGDQVVSAVDFSLLRANFGMGGAPPMAPDAVKEGAHRDRPPGLISSFRPSTSVLRQ